MNQFPSLSILEHFADLEDPRLERTKEHLLLDIVAIAICAVLWGADSWVDIESYGEAKADWLKQFLSLPNGIPSHDTFARVFARVDPEQLQQCFLSWIEAISDLTVGEVVAIDGKQLRDSYHRGEGRGAIQMVSAWASANQLVLGQRKVNEKSNEITAIPELLRVLALSGCIVTIDAMGCQKAIAAAIVAKGADYVLALKANQSALYEDVEWLFKQAKASEFSQIEHDFHQTIDKGHGRIDVRQCWTLSKLDYLVQKSQWQGLQSVAMVEAQLRIDGKVTIETRYISSLPSNAQQIATAIRTHWSIENSLHWVLDVSFREDDSRIRKDHAPQSFALLRQIARQLGGRNPPSRQIALNLLTQEKTAKVGVKAKRKKAGWDDAYLAKVLTQ